MKVAATFCLSLLAGMASALPGPRGVSSTGSLHKKALSTFAGTNAYWLPFLTSDTDVDTTLKAVADAGLTVVRTWGFNDATDCSGVYFQCWSSGSPVINTGSDGLARLDAVVKSAESNGIKLVIPLVNNWSDYGGMDVYVKALGGSTHGDFYNNTDIISAYKNYIKEVVGRYSSSSAILAWELANEPRCTGCDTSVVTTWATTISAYIKSLDSTHLVAMGDEGFMNDPGASTYPYQGSEGMDFAANLKIASIDYGTLHLYPESWSQSLSWGNTWISDHATACAAAGKSCVVEEYGVSDKSQRDTVIQSWHSTIANSSGMSDQFWQFGVESLSSGASADDGYTIYTTDSDFTTLVKDWAATR